ncbi:MAG: PD40 domain-containing protein, partial [Acidobacteria bacterium]|nr:PD40 domain-containing protein [Acidobacteriota bacterium]
MRRTFLILALVFVVSPIWSVPGAVHQRTATLLPEAAPLATAAGQASGVAGYYRFPEIHDDTIVFAAEGDLWITTVDGGVAQRITTHPSEETDPVISPDGTTLAFTARYEGPAELYTMPLAGGVPTRQTYEADSSVGTTWTPDGKLVYTTGYYATLPVPQLIALDLVDHTRQRVPLSTASEATYDDSGDTLFFVRPAFHNNVTRRYVGGTARDVWKFIAGADEAIELTGDYEGESHSPMYWDGRVYFVTDRDGTMNVWSMNTNGGDLRQHTEHSGWDVRGPELSHGRIVYQLGADLWLYDIAADTSRLIPITLASDFDQLREKWETNPLQYLTSAHIHPEGDSIVLTARGRVFVAPAGSGRLVRAVNDEGIRYRDVMFMPDGESLVGLSDASGEFEWVRIPANGIGEPTPISDNGSVLRFAGTPSPDGRWIAFDDMNRDLSLLDIETGTARVISENREGIGDMAWSPDSRWLAYSMTAMNSFRQIKLYNVDTETTTMVTSDRTNSSSVAWDPQGDFLYFVSDRNLRSSVGSPWGARAPEPYFADPIKIYEVALRRGLRSPFRPDDELAGDEDSSNGRFGRRGGNPTGTGGNAAMAGSEVHDEQTEEPDVPVVEIHLEGIERRVREVPVEPGNYADLRVNDGAIFYTSRQAGGGRGGGGFGGGASLMALAFDSEDPEPITVVEGIRSAEVSANGEKILVRRGNNFYVIDARAQAVGDRIDDAQVNLDGWAFPMNVREDWRQIVVDAWRMERDYFYDPGMHGVDWDGALQKYLPLVDRVTTRTELSDLIGRFVGELSALHTSVRGGDVRTGDDSVSVPSLGARIFREPDLGGYRIDYIYQSDPDYPDEMSPLADPYLGIKEGDVIVAVNGVATLDVPDIGALLRNQGGRQVLLTLQPHATDDAGNNNGGSGTASDTGEVTPGNGSGGGAETRDVIVVPINNERNLRYSDWEYTRRLAVEERGEGRIGYVHLRAMGGNDITAWYRQFYPVFNREGLIIDVRRNSGGNIDSFILEKLMRRAWMYWQERVGQPTWNMQFAFRGHMVVLVDQKTASDGEAFAEGFRRLELGPVIGMRTWGGEIWLGSSNRLTDNGLARAPSMGVYGE